MSRCFPFPPPGYEKKARTDDVDLLKKEKDREKKHKKEKKNREKREGKDKEKREKDRSDGKHRDKKEKKEKQRDKKEKDRDKDKEKSTASDEKRLPVQADRNNGDKASDEKKLLGKSEINSLEILIQKGKERDLDRSSISGEKKFPGQFSGNNERVSQNSHLIEQPKESKFVQEVGRLIRDEARGTGKQLVEKFTGTDAKRDEGTVRLVAKATGTSADGKEKNKRGEDRKLDGQGIRDVSKLTGNSTAQGLPGMAQLRNDKTPRPLDKAVEKRIEGKEKNKKKEGDDKHGDKRKDKDKEKEFQGKDKDRDKEKKKEERVKEKNEHKNAEADKLRECYKDGFSGIQNAKNSHLPKESTKNAVTEGNLRKRKDPDTNGFFSGNDIKPSKVLRPTPSHPLTDNGKTLGSSQTSSPLSGRQGPLNNLKVDSKERKINGIIEPQAVSVSTTQLPSISTTKSLLATPQADKKADMPRKQPHPDLKYLSEVLTVPKMEEWSDFDDQEWLFEGNDSLSKKPKMGSFDETPQVWSEALRIESADVCALPYVIPY